MCLQKKLDTSAGLKSQMSYALRKKINLASIEIAGVSAIFF